MHLVLQKLVLLCKEAREDVAFSPHMSFFHGQMATGKSTIASLVDFCFGARLIGTPAVRDEVVAVQLLLEVNGTEMLIERSISESSEVTVTWNSQTGPQLSSLPVKAGKSPVVEPDIFNLSDFLMKALGFPILRVRQSKTDPDSDMRRVSFRNFVKFMYLDQDELDSSLFDLEVPIQAEHSKDVLKYVFGLHSERLADLELQYSDARTEQRQLREGAEQISEFLATYGFSSRNEIAAQIDALDQQIARKRLELEALTPETLPATSLAQEDMSYVAQLDQQIAERDETVRDLEMQYQEQRALAAELTSMKLRLARSVIANNVLEGAEFQMCPACGSPLEKTGDPEACVLCHTHLSGKTAKRELDAAIVERDLTDRVEDLTRSMKRFERSKERNQKRLEEFQEKRAEIQRRLDDVKRSKESEYIQRARTLESELGGLIERGKFLGRVKAMPDEIERRRQAADKMAETLGALERQMSDERAKFEKGRLNIAALEANLSKILRAIHFPDIGPKDKVQLNPKTWVPSILRGGSENRTVTFYDAGSGGKKVLFKIAYALAIHMTAAQHDLPLPQLLIIDSTMKNITPDINRDVVEHFYRELYRMLREELQSWQLVLIDQSYFGPEIAIEGSIVRVMTKTDPKKPPLVSYYKGD